MSNESSKPNYNLRSKRVSAGGAQSTGGASEGFIRASDLLRRQDEERGLDDIHPCDPTQQAASSQQMVPDLPSNNDDEGGGVSETSTASTASEAGDQRVHDSAGDTQRYPSPSPCSPLAQETVVNQGQEVLRLRVQEAWQLHNNEVWVRQCQLSKVGLVFPQFNGLVEYHRLETTS